MYKELAGQKIIPDDILFAKKSFLKRESKIYHDILSAIMSDPDVYDQFLLSLTYNSNKIEGSTLSENETADIMFNGQTVAGKNLVEHLEVVNHKAVLKYLFDYLKSG